MEHVKSLKNKFNKIYNHIFVGLSRAGWDKEDVGGPYAGKI
jgi:hypothetical protein